MQEDIKKIKCVLIAVGRTHSAIAKRAKTINQNIDGDKTALSTARWQVMSAITATKSPTISKVARGLKSTRQNISILVEAMIKEKFIFLRDNPEHKRAKLLSLSEQGKIVLTNVSQQRDIWCEGIQGDISSNDLQTTRTVLLKLAHALEKEI